MYFSTPEKNYHCFLNTKYSCIFTHILFFSKDFHCFHYHVSNCCPFARRTTFRIYFGAHLLAIIFLCFCLKDFYLLSLYYLRVFHWIKNSWFIVIFFQHFAYFFPLSPAFCHFCWQGSFRPYCCSFEGDASSFLKFFPCWICFSSGHYLFEHFLGHIFSLLLLLWCLRWLKSLPAMQETWVDTRPGRGHGNPLKYSCLENPHRQKSPCV